MGSAGPLSGPGGSLLSGGLSSMYLPHSPPPHSQTIPTVEAQHPLQLVHLNEGGGPEDFRLFHTLSLTKLPLILE